MDVTPLKLEKLIVDVDLILDGTDNFDIRMIINDSSQKFQIPWIYGSCVGSYGMTYSIIPGEGPCLHCLRSEEHTSELQSRGHIVCRLLLEKKKINNTLE